MICIKKGLFKKYNFKGAECCSNTGIGFHNIKDAEHYKMDYFLYRLRQPINYTFVKA